MPTPLSSLLYSTIVKYDTVQQCGVILMETQAQSQYGYHGDPCCFVIVAKVFK